MTNTTTTTTAHHDDLAGSTAFPDPRPHFATALRIGQDVIAAVQPHQLELPTPCDGFSVDQLSAHLLAVVNRIGVLGAGGDFHDTPQSIDVASDGRATAYASFADAARRAWTPDESLQQRVTMPWGELPGAVALMIYVNEVSVHSWDLATATGQRPAWDEGTLALAYAAMQQGLPREGRSADGTGADGGAPFAPVVDVDPDAPLIDRLVGWNGRRP